jgi:hypothetical protein
MKLINTLEINPYDYSKNEYQLPSSTSASAPSEWNNFWLKCISDSNLGGLKSIYPDSYLVDIETINSEQLSEILKKELNKIDLDEFEYQIEQLCGGVAIEVDDNIIITPSCCGDLGNLSGWEDIFSSEVGTWQKLWIGHPWIFYKRIGGMVEISEYSDSNLEDFKDIKAIYTLLENELFEEVKRIRRLQNDFTDKIRAILSNMKVANARDISNLMTGAD